MTDLLARLRAVNPVPTCDPPTVEDVWRKLEHEDQIPRPNAPRPDLNRRRGRSRMVSRVRLRLGHVGLGLAVAVPVLVAGLAIVLLGHHQPASLTRPAYRTPVVAPSHTGAASSIDVALADGNRPLAPDAKVALPVLGSSATRSLASFRGKVVVLNVFASWCRPCRAPTAALEQAQAVIAGQGATVLGVTYEDKPAASEAFVRATHINYPVLRDPNGRFVRSFGVYAVPETFVIDRHGRIAAARRGGQINDRWLTQTLARLFPSEHLIPAGWPLKSPPTTSQLTALAEAYPVLARRQQPTDIPPHGVLDPYVVSRGGLAANSRRALVTPRGETLYIVPAHRSICVASSDNVAGGCQPFPFTATTPADIGATICAPHLPPTELEVAGLMPPHASDIKIHYTNGTSQPVLATNGMIAIYAHRAGPLPKSITWMSPQGPQHTGTAVPPDAASSKCAS
jgi:cytochrome c biogenesis protein CcmG/thiol:disulfide interchange protein DsbE